ncbi:MAG: TlpA family protein disulfide reductase [Deltaproteobacteria bacterium]|nr:TlpA family protein disulfide reductase [Deltaproteobacteria bacterium]
MIESRRFPGSARRAAAAAAAGRFLSGFRWFAAVVVTASVVLLPPDARSFGLQSPAAMKTASVEKAPDFVLRDLTDRKFRLSDFRGKQPVLIVFSATWCAFCKEEIPRYKFIHATYAKQGLEIVNIDIQESKEKVARFAARQGLPYRVLLDREGIVAGIYGIRGVPSMVLVDANGNILCRQCQRVEPLIEAFLKKR